MKTNRHAKCCSRATNRHTKCVQNLGVSPCEIWEWYFWDFFPFFKLMFLVFLSLLDFSLVLFGKLLINKFRWMIFKRSRLIIFSPFIAYLNIRTDQLHKLILTRRNLLQSNPITLLPFHRQIIPIISRILNLNLNRSILMINNR